MPNDTPSGTTTDHAAALAAAEMRGREEAALWCSVAKSMCERARGNASRQCTAADGDCQCKWCIEARDADVQAMAYGNAVDSIRALPPPPGTSALDARLREERRKVWEVAVECCEQAQSRAEHLRGRAMEDAHEREIAHQEGRFHGAQDVLDEIRARMEAD